MAHKALGRGLHALFTETKTVPRVELPAGAAVATIDPANLVKEIPINNIKPNRHQPRLDFDETALQELSQSIKLHGLAQPLVVSEGEGGEYELVVGERRLRASKLAGLATVPCLIRKISNRERFEMALIENIQREDLNAIEEAIAIDGLMREFNLTQEDAAEALGKSRSAIANVLRLLKLHEDVQAALRSGQISEGHAKVLAGTVEHSEQLRLLDKIIKEQLSVRDLEKTLSKMKSKKQAAASGEASVQIPEAKKFEEDFQRILGRRVEIQTDGKKGWIRFAFYSPWDLELLCKKMGLLDPVTGEPNL